MKCPHPVTLAKKDANGNRLVIPCGRCFICKENRREEWSLRIQLEAKFTTQPMSFVTLTYNDSSLIFRNGVPSLNKRDVILFLKKLRHAMEPFSFRYYLLGEYGSKTQRPHYHVVFFGVGVNEYDIINDCWNHGNIDVKPFHENRAYYISKYHTNVSKNPHGADKSFVLMSKGIASCYADSSAAKLFHVEHLNNAYIPVYNFKKRMPRYLKERLYSKEEREKISRLVPSEQYPKFENSKQAYEHFRQLYYDYLNGERRFINKNSNSLL